MVDEVPDSGEEVSPRGSRSFVGRLRGQVNSSHAWTKSKQLYGTIYQPESNVDLNVRDEMLATVSKHCPTETAELFVYNSTSTPFALYYVSSNGALLDNGLLPAAVGTAPGKSRSIYNVPKDCVFVCLHPSEVIPGHLRDVSEGAVVFQYQVSSAEPVRHNLTVTADTVEDVVQYTTKVDILTLSMKKKVYVTRRVGGIAVHLEKGLESDLELLCALHEDVAAVSLLLPSGIWEKLKLDCKVFVHMESRYGPVDEILSFTGARVHNNWDWLLKQAFSTEMYQNVDVSNASAYLESRNAWGTGQYRLFALLLSRIDSFPPIAAVMHRWHPPARTMPRIALPLRPERSAQHDHHHGMYPRNSALLVWANIVSCCYCCSF
jgi:hypothetical protein